MKLFDDTISDLRKFINNFDKEKIISKPYEDTNKQWPSENKGNIVLKTDTGVELGNPSNESVSFQVWTNEHSLVNDGSISLIGPDLPESLNKSLPFGKIAILGVNDFNEENCFEKHREIDLLRYDLNLKGYMMRAVSQYMREWSRVSKEAIADGFSLFTLAGNLIDIYRQKDFISSVEIMIITSTPDDVRSLKTIGNRANRLISAMNKMMEEMSFDCDTCDYTDICSEVEDLRSIRDSLDKRQ